MQGQTELARTVLHLNLACPYHIGDARVLVMESAKKGESDDRSNRLHRTAERVAFVESNVRSGSDSAISAICLYVRLTLGSGRHLPRLFLPNSASSGLASPQLRAPSFETYLAQHRWNVRSNLHRSAVR